MGSAVGLQGFVAVDVGDGDFGGGNQPEILALALEQVFLELGQLAGAEQAAGVHHEGRQHFGVAVLAGVHVEHEVDERALQFGPQVPVEREAGAGDFGGALQVEDAQILAQVPVRLGFEIELGRLRPTRRTSTLSRSDWPTGTDSWGTLGMPARSCWNSSSSGLLLIVQPGDLGFPGAHLVLQGRRVAARLAQRADLRALGVHPRLELLGLRDGRAAAPVEFAELVEIGRVGAGSQTLRNAVEVRPEIGQIVHVPPC